nr:hypothetical protein [Tanacetum cinerariifolium]
AAGHHHHRQKSFSASFSGEPQKCSSSPDLFDLTHHSPSRAAHTTYNTTTAGNTMAAAAAHHHTPTAITIHTPPSPSTPLYTLVTTTPPSPPRPPQQRWLFQPLPPSWRAVGDGSVTTAAANHL